MSSHRPTNREVPNIHDWGRTSESSMNVCPSELFLCTKRHFLRRETDLIFLLDHSIRVMPDVHLFNMFGGDVLRQIEWWANKQAFNLSIQGQIRHIAVL